MEINDSCSILLGLDDFIKRYPIFASIFLEDDPDPEDSFQLYKDNMYANFVMQERERLGIDGEPSAIDSFDFIEF